MLGRWPVPGPAVGKDQRKPPHLRHGRAESRGDFLASVVVKGGDEWEIFLKLIPIEEAGLLLRNNKGFPPPNHWPNSPRQNDRIIALSMVETPLDQRGARALHDPIA